MIRRFKSSELGESASRRVWYDFQVEYAKSSRARCRVCNANIPEKEVRLALMLQDEEGYKSAAWTHFDCFWKHNETKKLRGIHELYGFQKLKPADKERVTAAYESFIAGLSVSKTKSTNKSNAKKSPQKRKKEEDSEEEEEKEIEEEEDDDPKLSGLPLKKTTKRKKTAGTSKRSTKRKKN